MEKISLKKFARVFVALLNCIKSKNDEWKVKHSSTIDELCKNLPHGSGLDAGCSFDFENSKPDKLIFLTSFHHLDENGMYSGWTYHKIIIVPSLAFGYEIKITGKDRNQIKDYLGQLFAEIFTD